ncbi:MAG TPA: Tex-like N-terminal domain-containing protein, partial [Gemmataceae bacterium]|nr:Tex-like N-terminal domain-containing protein [Gemmataceae bacterium]
MQPPVMPTEPEPQATPSSPPESAARQDNALDLSRIAQSLQIRKVQVENVVQLLDEGNTIPFITRYRKERTGGLQEDVLRLIQARVTFLRQLADRRRTILRSIEGQGKLTDDLKQAILAADTVKRLEDLYLPYKPKRRSLASAARERGLEPLSQAILDRDPVVANLQEVLAGMLNPEKGLNTVDDVLLGVGHIWAERFAEAVEIRANARRILWETGKVRTIRSEKLPADKGQEYKDYFEFAESARRIPPHRILAINRGEKENALKIRLEFEVNQVRRMAHDVAQFGDHPQRDLLEKALEDALERLLLPSLEREIRSELTEEAEEHAVRIFARNLKSLLMQPPLRGRRILAIDPGFRTGCKLAALSEVGEPLGHGVAYLIGKGEKKKPRDDKPAAVPGSPSTATTVPVATAQTAPAAEPSVPATNAPAAGEPAQTAIAAPEAVVVARTSPEQPAVDTSGPPASSTPLTDAVAAVLVDGSTSSSGIVAPAPEATTAPAPAGAEPAPKEPPPTAVVRAEAKARMADLIRKHSLEVIAIGNGTACRETEELAAELIAEQFNHLAYVIVNEAGASVYSASPVGREEFPDFDATLRGTISIG